MKNKPKSTLLQRTVQPEITILFQVKKTENLSRLTVLFWNAGKVGIGAVDVAGAGAPCVEFAPGTRIISYVVKATSSDDIGFGVVREAENLLRLGFEHLNPGHGAVFEVLYETIGQERQHLIKLRTSIKGAGLVEVARHEGYPSLSDSFVTLVSGAVAALIAFGCLLSGLLLPCESLVARIPLVTIGAFLCFLVVRSIHRVVRRYQEYQVPDFARPCFE
jgi:hypothetical protein